MHFGFNPIFKFMADLRDYGLEWTSRRYYGLYGGEVTDNVDDQQGQARVKVGVGVLGIGRTNPNGEFEPTPLSRRAHPTSIYAGKDHGIYFPPEKGDAVWVSFDHGDPAIPRYHGSWWRNPTKTYEGSEVPAEFKTKGPPKRRGIKTLFGHGLVFSDDDTSPYVALWSGLQTGEGQEAIRRQQITLSDSTSAPTVKGVDDTVKEGIYANTFYGHRIALNDTDKKITISGLRADPSGQVANSVEIDDLLGKITIKTKTQQQIVIDDTTGQISIVGTGAVNVTAPGGVNLASGAGAPAVSAPPGVAVETGAGAKIINFVGAITQTVASMAITASASFTVNSPIITLGPSGVGISLLGGLVQIGNFATAQQVTNAELINWLKTHTHTGNLGAPTPLAPADLVTLQDPSNPALPNPLLVTETRIS